MERKSSLELFGHGCANCIWESSDGTGWVLISECFSCAEARAAAALSTRPTYRMNREMEYPSVGDQLDALMKCIKKLKADGVAIGPEAEAWVAACEAVKEKYPKPEA